MIVAGKKAAIIGFGGMGQRHLSAYLKIGVEVVAIADLFPEKVCEIVPSFDSDCIYKTYAELLSDQAGEIDIMSVVTNGPTHAEVTIAGSVAGVPNILCEKPMATCLRDAQNVINTCKRNNTRLAVNHIRRWSSNYSRLKSLLSSGTIGDVRHLYFSCGSTGIGNFAIHFFDTARYITESEPEWIVGFLDKTGTPNPRGAAFSDPGGYGIIGFRNGSRFFIDTSEDTGVQYTFQIVGTTGRIIVDELNDTWQIRARSEKDRIIPLTRYGTDMPQQPFLSDSKFDIVDLTSKALAELLAGGPISSSGTDGKKSLELVIALHISDKNQNQKIYLPLQEKEYSHEVRIA